MKASDLLALVKESSKGTKSVEGEVKTPSYDNMNTPDNHVAGKGTKEVTNAKKDFGKKRDKRNPANPGKPKKGEKRDMGGTGKSYKKMSEAAPGRPEGLPDAAAVHQQALHTIADSLQELDMDKGMMVVAPDRHTARAMGVTPGQPITIQMDPDDMKRIVKPAWEQIKNSQVAGKAFQLWAQLVTKLTQATGMKQKAATGKRDTAPNIYKGGTPEAPEDWAIADSEDGPDTQRQKKHAKKRAAFSPAQAHHVKKMGYDQEEKERKDESYADSNSMAEKQPVKHRGAVSKTAKVRGKVNDEPENKADPGKPKNDGKSVMGPGASPEKAKEVHEGIKDLEKLLGRKLKIK